ncbi:MarR family transcriptional regulator [Streptomyces sp. NPDC059477]|uniref:MarR family transcriptional regulator n=1 Tax=Streptomyces sp. NPDC059477 TaxID=3346847 RepID=UPI0036781F0F
MTSQASQTSATPATSAPVLNPSVIGVAHYAGRAVLETVLARHGATFLQLMTLRPVALADGTVERAELIRQVTGSLKTPEAEVDDTIDALVAAGLVAADGSGVRATDAGRALHETSGAETRPISARIYAGIPADDLAVAGRVLTLITERANAELAALREGR